METNQTHKDSFSISTPFYEGPLELVLELIEKRKLLINDLALASITDDFIQHVRKQDIFPVEETAHFIGVAAMLLLIKSKSLIPNFSLTEEEAEDVEDLTHRLAMYEKVREAARIINSIFEVNILFSSGTRPHQRIFAPGEDMSAERLPEALLALLMRRKENAAIRLPEARVRQTISIEEVMDRLATRIQSAFTLSFREFSAFDACEKENVIVSFLALLELVKQGAVEAAQYDSFGDIRMTNTTADVVPSYGRSE